MQRDAEAVPSQSAQNDYLLGLLAVRKGYVTQAQMKEALEIRQRSAPTPRLTDVLYDLAGISMEQRMEVFEAFCSLLLGSIAIRMNCITEDQLFEALEIQESSAGRPLLGTVLVGLGYLSGESLGRILAKQESALTEALVPPSAAPAPPPRRRPSRLSDSSSARRAVATIRRPLGRV
jgi:hypothetical protein